MKLSLKSKIFLVGHNGLVGSALLRFLKKNKFKNIITVNRKKLDLRNFEKVKKFFSNNKIDFVINCAARVGGINANSTYPADFILDNLSIQNNILINCRNFKIKRTIFLGSSCVYPKKNKIPIKEDYLLTGKLEKTNQAYAIAKIAGIKACESLFIQDKMDLVCLMPTNVYGINDNFDKNSSHVVPGMISKFIEAQKNNKKKIELWGTGKPIREFIFEDDLAEAIFFVLKAPQKKIIKVCNNQFPMINIGTKDSITIKNLAKKIKNIVNYKGKIFFNRLYPDGTFIKNLDSSRIRKLGWKPKVRLDEGLRIVINSKL